MKTKERKCECREILHREFGRWHDNLVVHLMGCPENSYTERYNSYSFWKRLFRRSPEKIYSDHHARA